MMKVLIITLNINSGIIHYTSQLANALVKQYHVTIICPICTDKKYFSSKIKIIELPLGNVLKNFFINTLIISRPITLIKKIYKEKPDIIHFQGCHLWMCFVLPFLKKIPLVVTIHDVRPHFGTRKFDQIIGQKYHIYFSKGIIIHGETMRDDLYTLYDLKGKICRVIPIGGFSFFLNEGGDKEIEEKDTILFFGYIFEYKGLSYLIDAVRIASSELHNIKLIIAGQGDINKYLTSIKNSHLFEIHNKFIPDSKVPSLFQRSQVVVLPYIEASQTGIIPIAYAFKKPVIVTKVGCIHEVVEDGKTGFIIPLRDSNALANAIIKLLKDDKLRKAMGERGYKKMETELSWDSIAEKTSEFYKEVIKQYEYNK
jgi:alpha-maltose-1-phosphate synthase